MTTAVPRERAFLVCQFLPTIVVERSEPDAPDSSPLDGRDSGDMRKSRTMPNLSNLSNPPVPPIPPPPRSRNEVASSLDCSSFFARLLKAVFYPIARRRRRRAFAYP